MRKLPFLATVIAITVTGTSFGQSSEGVITYETRTNLHRNLPPGQEGRKAIDPEYRIIKNQLFFNASEELFKPLIEEDEDEAAGGRRRFQPRTQYYLNQSAGKLTVQQSIRGKDYLVEDSVKVLPWKFGTELKVVLGYTCKQAFFTDTTRKVVTAWYTDKLRPFLGPETFNSLPGAVLAVDINNAERVLVATKIDLRPLKAGELALPTRGQKVTPAEFRKMLQEMRAQMQNFRQRN